MLSLSFYDLRASEHENSLDVEVADLVTSFFVRLFYYYYYCLNGNHLNSSMFRTKFSPLAGPGPSHGASCSAAFPCKRDQGQNHNNDVCEK